MNSMFTIFKKEMTRFFKDRRMVFTVLMPGLLIYFLYSLMGDGMMQQFMPKEDHTYSVYTVNMPQSLQPMLQTVNAEVTEVKTEAEQQEVKNDIAEQKSDILLVFAADFDSAVAAYDNQSGAPAPQVRMYYNSASNESNLIYSQFSAALEQYETALTNKFDVNAGEEQFDLASDEDVMGKMFSMMMPLLLMMFVYSGCMSIAPESIAGEKERGTIATLLVTPAPRSQIALGKILALSVIALISGASSFIGTMLAMPKMMGAAESLNVAIYSTGDYLMLLGIILSLVLFMIAMLSVISCMASSVKEAGTYNMPLMLVVMFAGISGMMVQSAPAEAYWYLIPLFNTVQAMQSIFAFDVNLVNVLVTIGSNVVYTGLLCFLLTKMFNSEKVMFRK